MSISPFVGVAGESPATELATESGWDLVVVLEKSVGVTVRAGSVRGFPVSPGIATGYAISGRA